MQLRPMRMPARPHPVADSRRAAGACGSASHLVSSSASLILEIGRLSNRSSTVLNSIVPLASPLAPDMLAAAPGVPGALRPLGRGHGELRAGAALAPPVLGVPRGFAAGQPILGRGHDAAGCNRVTHSAIALARHELGAAAQGQVPRPPGEAGSDHARPACQHAPLWEWSPGPRASKVQPSWGGSPMIRKLAWHRAPLRRVPRAAGCAAQGGCRGGA